MKRFDVINGSKFDRLSNEDMSAVKGGTTVCISCMKRDRKHTIVLHLPGPEFDQKEYD